MILAFLDFWENQDLEASIKMNDFPTKSPSKSAVFSVEASPWLRRKMSVEREIKQNY